MVIRAGLPRCASAIPRGLAEKEKRSRSNLDLSVMWLYAKKTYIGARIGVVLTKTPSWLLAAKT